MIRSARPLSGCWLSLSAFLIETPFLKQTNATPLFAICRTYSIAPTPLKKSYSSLSVVEVLMLPTKTVDLVAPICFCFWGQTRMRFSSTS
uniref:Putative secreted protein n=1 Tax=Anopheles darlingi TaxID=43151 RepID=A0A2M4D114_ANODA